MGEPDLIAAAEHAARSARRAVTLALVAVAVAVAVLAIDNSIKRSIISEAQQVRGMLDEIKALALGTVADAGTAGTGPADSSARADAGDAVDGVAGAHAAPVPDADGAAPATRSRARRTPRGAGGDG